MLMVFRFIPVGVWSHVDK